MLLVSTYYEFIGYDVTEPEEHLNKLGYYLIRNKNTGALFGQCMLLHYFILV